MRVMPSSAQDTVAALVAKSQRRTGVQIRSSFLQARGGGHRAPGPLARFVRCRDARALDLYLLVRLLATKEPFSVTQPSSVWGRAMGLGPTSTPSTVSKV